ncbi:Na(+)/H(+) exchange regulatory cofactor NHE-RF4 [Ambystoma mexicanum]|uniref:Na(+)/H(+) exchange regulatory cofactor NHE-RF4 n=1 Tax=Ambystoma mexicanum TaxID=8296 RepID=UPI0037E798E6
MKERGGLNEDMELPEKFQFDPKQGIDNPALSLADDIESGEAFEPRFCSLTKPDGGTFGFFLRHEFGSAGHVIRQVEVGGPAYHCGLRDGDRLLEVNGEYVDDMNPLRVVQKIKGAGKQISLAVLDQRSYLEARARHLNTAMLLPGHGQTSEAGAKPRLCYVRRVEGGFGFSLSASEDEKSPFHLTVNVGGPAEAAGLPSGSRLLELNGAGICHLTKTQVNKKLKQAGPAVALLVMEPNLEQFYCRRGIKVTAAMADPSTVPFKARKLHLVKGPDGYGFLLRQEKHASKAEGQFLREVEAGLPAQKAGMKDGDRLLAVNGKVVEGLTHEDVVYLICMSGSMVTLLVIDYLGDQFYSIVGLSPLLFYEDEHLTSPGLHPHDDSLQPATGSSDRNVKIQPRPRLCHLRKESSGYGFHLGNITDEDEIFVAQVVPESPAQRAGLKVGDLLIEINGTNVEKRSYKDVIRWLKEDSGGQLTLLVVDREGYTHYRDRGLTICAGMAETAGQKAADDTELHGREE